MTSESVSRRQFAKRLGAVATGISVASCAVDGDGVAAADETKTPEKEPTTKSQTDLALELIQQKFPDQRLDEAAITGIRDDLIADFARSHVLSSYPLKNSDEPGFVFAAYRADQHPTGCGRQ